MVAKKRTTRIGDRIREELSEILLTGSNDPRLKGVSVTDVEVDRELAYADVHVCAIEGVARASEVLAALDRAQGFLRSELARRVELRTMPRLRFHWDPTFEHADKIERLIASLHQTDDDQGGKPE
ncbi:MAG TPA: 30S ribosome-binding factor RbfA [Anaerolineales bacterium]|nr:30S ribosome-binding factor RbfA [Anaerolineales bacterium]